MATFEPLGRVERGLLATHRTLLFVDHLLLVRRSAYREFYRRIELADIQAMVVGRTSRWLWMTAFLGACLVASVLLAVFFEQEGRLFWGLVALALAVTCGVHLRRGPSCRCLLRTPMGWVNVPSWRRLRDARRAFERWAPLAASLQGASGPIEPVEALRRASEIAPVLRLPTQPSGVAPRRMVSHRWHTALAALLMANLVAAVADRWIAPGGFDVFMAALQLTAVALAIVAIAVQAGSRIARGLRRWAVVCLVVLTLDFVISLYIGFLLAVTRGAAGVSLTAPARPGLPTLPNDLPEPLSTILAVIAMAMFLGLWTGWLAVRNTPDNAELDSRPG